MQPSLNIENLSTETLQSSSTTYVKRSTNYQACNGGIW